VAGLQLRRPLLIFDLETTGTDPLSDRIVEISALRLGVDGGRELRTRRLNPERPIPAAATAVHGIHDRDVQDEPTFRQISRSLLAFIGDADFAGFNVRRFDLPLLEREFRDCGLDLQPGGRKVIDAMTIFHRKESRDLSAAVRFYLNREHTGAHGAEADVTVTAEVLEAQLERYEDLPRAVDELDAWLDRGRSDAGDRPAKFCWREGELVFTFGKHQGRPLREIADRDSAYLQWIVQSDFPEEAKRLVRDALNGEYPDPPSQST
jgi:DNA polymerase-3 subunit epsilon